MSTAPHNAAAVIETLKANFDALSPQLQRAARWVIDHPREIGLGSVRALAADAEVHPNTLVRLAQSIGFPGFEAMRERFRNFLVADDLGSVEDRAAWLDRLAEGGGSARVVASIAETTIDNVESAWRGVDPERLERAASLLVNARSASVLGVGATAMLAQQFAYVASVALPHLRIAPGPGGHPIDEGARLGEGDVLLAMTFQPYRADTMAAARRAKKRGAALIGLSDSASAPLARLADIALTAPTHTPHVFPSFAAACAILEGLTALLVTRAGAAAARELAAFHRERAALGLYEEDAPLARIG